MDKVMIGIVYNACFGGFGLSSEAIVRYAEIKGIDCETIRHREIPRNDPALVQVVEEMKEKSSFSLSNLAIKYLPKGTRYRISEYDGFEEVETPESIKWEVA